ncbi:MAG: hypothetical protein M3548_22875 [Actinomycetota bacterium]|nr:hypothetical protein [Actinomycetota bacterium]
MKNIPVELSGHKVQVTEAPTMKMKQDDKTGESTVATSFNGETLFVVSVFVKPLPDANGRVGKGSEVKVTLETDPGEIAEGSRVELINPRVSHWEMSGDGRTSSGLSWKASGLKPAA